MADIGKQFPEWDNLLVTYRQTLNGEWLATVPRAEYEEFCGRGMTQVTALERLRKLILPKLMEETKGDW